MELENNRWQKLQQLFKNINLITTSETKLKKDHQEALQLYYLHKNTILFLQENNFRHLGFTNTLSPQPKPKIKITNSEMILGFPKLRKYLFSIRNNLTFQISLIHSLTKYEEQKQIAAFIVHFFLDEITNTSSKSLLQLIDKLIEIDLQSNPALYITEFLTEHSFIGILLMELCKTNEISDYSAFVFKDIMNDIDGTEISKLHLSIEKNTQKETLSSSGIFEIINKKEVDDCSKRHSALDVDLSKSYINNISMNPFITISETENSYLEKSNISSYQKHSHRIDNHNNNENANDINCSIDNANQSTISGFLKKHFCKIKNINQQQQQNTIYKQDYDQANLILINFKIKIIENSLTDQKLYLKYHNETNPMTKELLFNHLQISYEQPMIFSSEQFNNLYEKGSDEAVNDCINHINRTIIITEKIIKRFLKINCIPETIRNICHSIATIIMKCYPNCSRFNVMKFVGKFFFENCFSKIVCIPEIYGITMNEHVLSINTRSMLIVLSRILSKLFRLELFMNIKDPLCTPFNHYFLQWFPLIFQIIESMIMINENDPFDHSLPQRELQSFAIDISTIELIIDKAPYIIDNEKEYKDLRDIKRMMNSDIIPHDDNPECINEKVYYLFLSHDEHPLLSNRLIPKIKCKLLEYEDNTNSQPYDYLEEITCAIFQLFISMPFGISKQSIDVVVMFNEIHQKILFYSDQKKVELSKTIPLVWFTQYIVDHITKIPIKYSSNNYVGLYEKIYKETNEIYQQLNEKHSLLTFDLTTELNILLAKNEQAVDEKRKMTILLCDIFKLNFIETAVVPVCFMSGIDLISCEQLVHSSLNKFNLNGLNLSLQDKCIHSTIKQKKKALKSNKKKLQNQCHCNTIQEFINKFKEYSLFTDEKDMNAIEACAQASKKDLKNKKNHEDIKPNAILLEYIEFIRSILENFSSNCCYDIEFNEKIINDFIEDIQEYIVRHSWNKLHLPESLVNADKAFYETCFSLSWVDPVIHLHIKKEFISEYHFSIAMDFLRKIDDVKSASEILRLFEKATDIIMKSLLFSTNKHEIGADDLNPIYVYLFLKVKLKRMASQLKFCNLFLTQKNSLGKNGYLITSLEWTFNCIRNIDYKVLNISEQEYNNKCIEMMMLLSLNE